MPDPKPPQMVVVDSSAVTDEMKTAYGEAVYYTTDTRLLPENIFRAMCAAAPSMDWVACDRKLLEDAAMHLEYIGVLSIADRLRSLLNGGGG